MSNFASVSHLFLSLSPSLSPLLQAVGSGLNLWSSSVYKDASHTDFNKYTKCEFTFGDTFNEEYVCTNKKKKNRRK